MPGCPVDLGRGQSPITPLKRRRGTRHQLLLLQEFRHWKADVLHAAITAAAADRQYADVVVDAYLKPDHARAISDTIFKEPNHRAVWRAVALGASTRNEIADITGYSNKTIGNLIPELLDRLVELDFGLVRPGRPLHEIVRYASRNGSFSWTTL